jgi:epoxyqueuosine reductase
MQQLAAHIKAWGKALGFQQIGITDADLAIYEPRFLAWLKKGFQAEMHYMAQHGLKRTRPSQLKSTLTGRYKDIATT